MRGPSGNLSAKGCRIDSIISPYTGMQLTVQLHIPGESRPIVIDNAAVRWSESAGIGLEFLTVAPASRPTGPHDPAAPAQDRPS